MDFCFLFLDKCISLEEELSSLLSIAGKIAVIHMNSTQSAIIDICVLDFTTRCYSIFSVVNNLQCFKMINHQLIVCVFLKGISSYFKIILNIYFLLKPSKNCFLIQVKYQHKLYKFSLEIMSIYPFLFCQTSLCFPLQGKMVPTMFYKLEYSLEDKYFFFSSSSSSGSMLNMV